MALELVPSESGAQRVTVDEGEAAGGGAARVFGRRAVGHVREAGEVRDVDLVGDRGASADDADAPIQEAAPRAVEGRERARTPDLVGGQVRVDPKGDEAARLFPAGRAGERA